MNPCACTNTHKRLLCSEKYIRNRLDKQKLLGWPKSMVYNEVLLKTKRGENMYLFARVPNDLLNKGVYNNFYIITAQKSLKNLCLAN